MSWRASCFVSAAEEFAVTVLQAHQVMGAVVTLKPWLLKWYQTKQGMRPFALSGISEAGYAPLRAKWYAHTRGGGCALVCRRSHARMTGYELVEGERLEWPEELRVFLKEPVDFWRIRKLLPQK